MNSSDVSLNFCTYTPNYSAGEDTPRLYYVVGSNDLSQEQALALQNKLESLGLEPALLDGNYKEKLHLPKDLKGVAVMIAKHNEDAAFGFESDDHTKNIEKTKVDEQGYYYQGGRPNRGYTILETLQKIKSVVPNAIPTEDGIKAINELDDNVNLYGEEGRRGLEEINPVLEGLHEAAQIFTAGARQKPKAQFQEKEPEKEKVKEEDPWDVSEGSELGFNDLQEYQRQLESETILEERVEKKAIAESLIENGQKILGQLRDEILAFDVGIKESGGRDKMLLAKFNSLQEQEKSLKEVISQLSKVEEEIDQLVESKNITAIAALTEKEQDLLDRLYEKLALQ